MSSAVSVEPLPKQGCESVSTDFDHRWTCLSGTPAEAGVRVSAAIVESTQGQVSVEPLPKQGCEMAKGNKSYSLGGLSGTPAEAGVRVRGR